MGTALCKRPSRAKNHPLGGRWIAHMTAQKRFAIAKGEAGDLQKPEEKNNTGEREALLLLMSKQLKSSSATASPS
uniref:Uncharacterized protein n=1 Tax=Oryza nivara TaxID=4536 RepID=A0A0E0G3E6_ORYNI